MSHGISKETYLTADPGTTKSLTYDMMNHIATKVDEIAEDHDVRLKKLESRKRRDTVKASFSGFAGGFFAMIVLYVKNFFWK